MNRTTKETSAASRCAKLRGGMDLQTVIWLFVPLFVVHDLEELLFMEPWLDRHKGLLKDRLGSLADRFMWTTWSFAIAIAALFILFFFICRGAVRSLESGRMNRSYPIALTVMYVNAFTHLIQSLDFRLYTPGVATALLLMLPYTLYAFRRLVREGYWASRTAFIVISMGPMVLFVYLAASS